MNFRTKIIRLLAFTTCLAPTLLAAEIRITDQSIATENRLMALSIRSNNDIWTVGTQGTIFRSVDSGVSWQQVNAPDNSEQLEFRDVAALKNGVVIVMSAGVGKDSSIFRSSDNGKNWQHVMQATDANAFFNCVSFEDDKTGWLYGDAVQNRPYVLKTLNAGVSWQRQVIPIKALKNEGGFSSSGTCINSQTKAPLLVGAGNAETARLLIKDETWSHRDSPLKAGEAAGIFSLQRDGMLIFLAGGSLKTNDQPAEVFTYHLSQRNWQNLGDPMLGGAIYGSALTKRWLLVSNPQGISAFDRQTQRWQKIDSTDTWALDCDQQTTCWGVGAKGNVKQISFSKKTQ